MKRVVVVMLVLLAGGLTGGCVSEAEVRRVRDAAHQLSEQMSGAASESLQSAVAEADEHLTAAGQVDLTTTAQQIAPFLPQPVQAPLLLGLGLTASLLRAGQLKRALASVAKGIEKAKAEDEGFREAFSRSIPVFRATQTPAAARIIDETTHRQAMLRLPL